MRKSSASWKSRTVSSGMRRSSSERDARSRSFGNRASARAHSSAYLLLVPVKDLLSSPQANARTLADVLIELVEIADAMRHAGDVRMHADRHHARALPALFIELVEVVDAATQPFLGRMVLQRHHGDVVHLHRVGNGDHG